jgi:hypothetical protein
MLTEKIKSNKIVIPLNLEYGVTYLDLLSLPQTQLVTLLLK